MNALSLRDLAKTYRNGFTALKGISLDIEEGDFLALLGPNGAGKSTAINIVSSLVTKSSGSVSICGHDLDRRTAQAKDCIGLAPQEINFNQFETVADIVLNQAGYHGLPARQARLRTEHCLRRMALWDKRNTVSRRLSGGMKRRLMVAKALVHSPRLLILDEPTAGVDIEVRRSLWATLEEINRQGTTIILTTHYLEEAERLCRYIALIDRGRIVEHSAMDALLARAEQNQFILTLARPLAQAPVINDCRLTLKDARTLHATVQQRRGLNHLFAELIRRNIEVAGMKHANNRLEQWFTEALSE